MKISLDQLFSRAKPHPKWKENGDWSVGGNCIPSANYQVQVAGHFVLSITDAVCVCDCNYTGEHGVRSRCTIQLLTKSIVVACRVMLNAYSGCLWGC